MNFFLFFIPISLLIVIYILRTYNFSFLQIIVFILPMAVVFMVGVNIVDEINKSLCEHESEFNGETYSILFSSECNDADKDKVLEKKKDKDCIGRSGTISYMICDKSGRICESKVKEC